MHKSERHGFNWWRGESPAYRRALRVAAKLAARGHAKQVTPYLWVADGKPFCDNPRPLRIAKPGRDAGAPVEVNMWGPCRRCARCLLFRQMKWRERAIAEIQACHNAGRRTWWITLTISPVHMAGILAEAVVRDGVKDTRSIDRAAYPHVQRYLDRVRKAAKTRFRYLAIHERGEENGRSHYHLLLHECGPRPVLKATLDSLWPSFVHARLVDMDRRGNGLATYITKYATKDFEVRPRASSFYGRGPKTARPHKGRAEPMRGARANPPTSMKER